MKTVLIVLAYNGGEGLIECVESIKRTVVFDDSTVLMVVDNASTDGSVDRLEKAFPDVEIIRNKKNTGYTGGNNVGMRRALAEGAETIVLLNQDAVFLPGWLDALLKCVKPKDIGIAQSLILLQDDPTRVNSWGNDMHILGFGSVGGYRKTLDEALVILKKGVDITYAMGASMAIKREVLEMTGLFDEETFMYHDDMDLCLRARLLGWRVVVVPESRVLHDYHEGMNFIKYKGLEINRLWNPLKFYRLPTLILLFPLWLLFEFVGFVFALKIGQVRAWWSARWHTITHVRHIVRCRRDIQKTRTMNDRALLASVGAGFPTAYTFGLFERLARTVMNVISVGYWSVVSRVIFW